MVEGERPPLILRRIQSYWPDWGSPDDYTVHVDGGDPPVGRIFCRYAVHPRACLGCGRVSPAQGARRTAPGGRARSRRRDGGIPAMLGHFGFLASAVTG